MSAETSPGRDSRLRAALREPLLHFVVVGSLLFAVLAQVESGRRNVIDINGAEVRQLAEYWREQTGRPPSAKDLAALVEERVDEEVLAREAIRLGLDYDDIIIRRRLAQKMAFIGEDMTTVAEPSEADLRRYFEGHRASYFLAPTYALRHIYFSRDRHGARADLAARAALRALSRGAQAPTGDPFMLASQFADVRAADLEKDFGADFARAVAAAPPGRWVGPVTSPFGVHVIRVEAHAAIRVPDFADVRPQVHDALLAERRAAANAAYRKSLRARYKISIAAPGDTGPPETAGIE